MPPVIDPAIVAKELEKPIEMDKEMRRYAGDLPPENATVAHYTLRDRWKIAKETERLYRLLTKNVQKRETGKRFTVTAGGPGAGKTTLIRNMQKKGGPLEQAVHVDPDELLKKFKPYVQAVDALGNSDAGRTVAYTYWRWASVYMANTILNRLAEDGYDIALGITGTSPNVKFIYEGAKRAGYQTDLLICHASEDVRLKSVEKRFREERRFTPVADVKEKGNKLFPEIVGLHFAQADGIRVYWRPDLGEPVLAASTDGNRVVTRNQAALAAFKGELTRRKPDFDWEAVTKNYESRFSQPAPRKAGLTAGI